jgi:hypothetical protein
MSMGVKLVENAKTKLIESLTQQCTDTNNKFFEALKADPEIGGNKLEATVKAANVAYKHYFGTDKEASDLIQQSGLANNKAFVKMLYDNGERMQDGKILSGNPVGTKTTAAERAHPELAKKD